jgi:phospholipase D1/2
MSAALERRGAPAEAGVAASGRNCWRIARADRAAVLVDAAAYFDAVASAIARARHSVFILGWDVHSRVRLGPANAAGAGTPPELAVLLDAAAERSRRLRIYILDWDYSMLLTGSREVASWMRLDWRSHTRVRFRLDGRHPVGACHHQKLVVVDDAMAFVGGLDLTANRWDTPEHRADDPRRRNPAGEPYPPFHDVQIAVDGDAARLLGVLARERWRRATGTPLRAARAPRRNERVHDVWPRALRPDLEDVPVAIARTEPAYAGRPECREVQQLYLDSIAAARRWLYLENQYLSSRAIADALCESLAADEGPEILIVAPRECSGWLEETTMGPLRHRIVRRLREADHHGRLRICYPRLPGDPVRINVHSKLLIADERMLRIGSANLSNRSMGFDTECDLHVEARGDGAGARGISAVLARLLGEHLGCEPEKVSSTLAETGRLFATVDALGGGERRLEPLDVQSPEWADAVLPEELPTDPERPVEMLQLVEAWTPELLRDPHRRRLAPLVPIGVLLYALHRLVPRQQLIGALAGVGVGYAALRAWARRR